MSVKSVLNWLLRLGLVAGCLVYAFWGIDLGELWRIVMRYDAWAVLAVLIYSLFSYFAAGLRLNYLTGFTAGNILCLNAFMLSMGVNNIAPAKLGEITKALYLRSKRPFNMAKSLSIVFWERFFDLNALLLMGLAVALIFNIQLAFVPLAASVASIWGGLFFLRFHPEKAQRLIDLVPQGRLHKGLSQVRQELVAGASISFFLILGAYTAVCWLLYSGTTILAILWIAKIPLSLPKVLAVFVISSVGMAVPSSPGALGVFEAAMVIAMSLFGVDKEQALAVGLLIHMIMFVPTTVYGLLVLAKSGFKLNKLQQNLDQDEPCPDQDPGS